MDISIALNTAIVYTLIALIIGVIGGMSIQIDDKLSRILIVFCPFWPVLAIVGFIVGVICWLRMMIRVLKDLWLDFLPYIPRRKEKAVDPTPKGPYRTPKKKEPQ